MYAPKHRKILRFKLGLALVATAAIAWGCGSDAPTTPPSVVAAPTIMSASKEQKSLFDFNVKLFGPESDGDGDDIDHEDGKGRVEFRQPGPTGRIELGVKVQHLSPNTHYKLQRAVDQVVDDQCTSAAWLTLGKGTVPQDIVTDKKGKGREDLFRVLASPPGTTFDIHFRVIDGATPPNVVLVSDCYQFSVK